VEREIGRIPALRIWHAEATYLSWLDARALPINNAQEFLEEAGVGLYDGALFGAPGFLRLNFACPRPLLAQALERISRALRFL
jgi:cystathionine beta-lyase